MLRCTLCQRLYTSEFEVLRHKRAIHERRPYGDCAICGKPCMSSWGLSRHTKSHVRSFKFSCDDCDQGFQEAGALVTHKTLKQLNTVAESATKSSAMPRVLICIEKYTEKRDLLTKKQDVFKCATCGKILKTERYLTQHLIKHDIKRRYICSPKKEWKLEAMWRLWKFNCADCA